MGKRGPQKAPTELQQLEGVRPDRINQQAPTPAPGWPSPPVDISKESMAVWVQLRVDMEGTGHIRYADRDTLRMYCDLVVKQRQLQNQYEQMGPVIPSYQNCPKSCLACDQGTCEGKYIAKYVHNPIALQLRDTVTQYRIYARELGCTPSARSDIKDPTVIAPKGGGDFF